MTDRTFTPRPREPYTVGNTAAVRHGATSPRQVAPLAAEFAASLVEVAPWAAIPSFRSAVAAWSHAEARATLLRRYVDEMGMLDDDGTPLPALLLLDKVEARAGRLRAELGLTPASWARLVARLGSADGDAAVAGLQRLKSIGKELAERAALPGEETS